VYDFEKDYWGAPGQLTPTGMRQHYLNGQVFRKRYIDEYKLLSPTYNPEEVYVRATDVNRTIMSAQSQLLGWYPDSAYQLESEETAQRAVPPMQIANLEDIQ
jgi:hypothetical protein